MFDNGAQTSNGMKKQVVVIHGGVTFKTNKEFLSFVESRELDIETLRNPVNDWKRNLDNDLGDEYEVLRPSMPNAWNAQYEAWKIWFEKLIPQLNDEFVLVGHSLGGIFLTKYLSENEVEKKIIATYIVAAPFDDECEGMTEEFNTEGYFEKLEQQIGKVVFYHSTDDPIVPFRDFEKYKSKLPSALFVAFEDRLHFFDEHFPELVADIKKTF